MEIQKLKKHSDFAVKADFIELPETNYDYNKDIRFDVFNAEVMTMAGTSTNTIMSQKSVGYDGDSDND
jgi:hypothetical protein